MTSIPSSGTASSEFWNTRAQAFNPIANTKDTSANKTNHSTSKSQANHQTDRSDTANTSNSNTTKTNTDNKSNKHTVTENGRKLTPQQLAVVLQLQKRDRAVHQHEMAHLVAGGQYVRGGPNYVYETGPDGKRYAVGGDVSIDTSPERDPRATLSKMLTVERAALAPKDPSPQDREVAAKAAQEAAKAQMEIIEMEQHAETQGIKTAGDNTDNTVSVKST